MSSSLHAIIGIHQFQIECIIGILPEERQNKQIIIIDMKVKTELSANPDANIPVDYVPLAEMCSELAKNQYRWLETFAIDIVETSLQRFPITWVWVSIQKPKAILDASYAYVELEKKKGEF